MRKIKPLKAGAKAAVKRKEWKIKVLHSDRNECRYHAHTGFITILYKNREGLTVMYEWAKSQPKEVLLAVSDEYHRLKREGA